MAKQAYIGVNNIARKIKNGYVGVNEIARKITKAYIGIGGVARPCWRSGREKWPIVYYGTIGPLGFYGAVAASVSTSSQAYFLSSSGEDLDCCDDSLSWGCGAQPPALSGMAGTSLTRNIREGKDYYDREGAVFGGGRDYDNEASDEVWWYYSSNRSSGSLSIPRYDLAAASVGDYALFGGGMKWASNGMSDVVDAFDSSLTLTTITPLGVARSSLSAASVGKDYALFVGGGPSSSTDAYNESLTRIEVVDSGLFGKSAAAGTDTHVLFSRFGRTVAYNESLTLIEADELSEESHMPSAATSVRGFALFGGGFTDNDEFVATVDIYDDSLTRMAGTPLSKARKDLGAATVGDYALFAGGIGYYKYTEVEDLDDVDAYVYTEE